MSCDCQQVTRSSIWTSIPKSGLTEMLPGEDVECYARRAPDNEDKSGGVDPTGKIITNAIVPDGNLNVNTKFELSQGSPNASRWRMVDPNTNENITISGLVFSESEGRLSGQVDELLEGRTFNVKIIAEESPNNEIDSRSYNFTPKKFKPSDDLKFIHPLPGSVATSKFGPRVPPKNGASGMHKGTDFAYPGGVTKDVLASCDGKVVKAGVGSGYGNVVYIHHFNGSGKLMAETRYAHLDRIYVQVGQFVSAGQPIGKEGNTGVGTGAHLHFEIRLGGDNPVDPIAYLNGEIPMNVASSSPDNVSGSITKVNNSNTVVTSAKVESGSSTCKTPINTSIALAPKPDQQEIADPRSVIAPQNTPSKDEVKNRIRAVLDKHPELDEEDKKFIMQTAFVESSYDPFAKNRTSSALGLFQMLNATAETYYAKMGVPATEENRCNIEYATEAMVGFYKSEILKYWTEFNNSGGTKLAGKTIKQTPHSLRYGELSKAEFSYGLIHHDGVGNAVNGIDLQGVQIAKSRGFG